MNTLPLLTIVVIELAGGAVLRDAVRRASDLARSGSTGCIEVMVALRASGAGFADFEHCPCVSGETIPIRRRAALDAARTPILVFVEDTILIDSVWLANVLHPFEDMRVAAAWGPIGIAKSLPPRSRALGVLEYGRFSECSTPKDGSRGDDKAVAIPGACMIYRTSALASVTVFREKGITEHEISTRLLHEGWTIVRHPDLSVSYAGYDAYGARLATRVGHGRLYASGHLATHGGGSRMVFACKAALLPLVLTHRAIRNRTAATTRSKAIAEFAWIAAMAVAWSLGEAIGALAGPGSSERSWR